tara:strand:+ start:20062 stop:20166 length:105 start_codon:yes stop_codon:yes gene_type:complete
MNLASVVKDYEMAVGYLSQYSGDMSDPAAAGIMG